jgi:short-subunit dehydrogenase
MRPERRTILLTGATGGIGAAAARRLGQAGCNLLLTGRNEVRLDEVAAAARDAGAPGVLCLPMDLTEDGAAEQLPQYAVERFGRLDVLINNAGVGLRGPLLDIDMADLRRVFELNAFAPLRLTRAAARHLAANSEGGLVINVGSIAGLRAGPGTGGYSAAKAALERASEALRLELAGARVRLSVLHPGPTATGFNAAALGLAPSRERPVAMASAEAVANALLRTLRLEPRDTFVSFHDRLLVTAAAVAPGLVDRLILSLFGGRYPAQPAQR